MKKKQGNISIIVIFILALVSLMALLSASYIRSIIENTGNLYGYYRSYYLAKGGIETSLVTLDNRNIGMEFTIAKENDINKNFLCDSCHVLSTIVSRTKYNSGQTAYMTSNNNESECLLDNAIQLKRGESRSVPLFYDPSTLTGIDAMESLLSKDIDIGIKNIGQARDFAISISLGSGAQSKIDRHKLTLTGQINSLSINDFLHTLQVTYLNPGETKTDTQLIYTLGNQTVAILPLSQTIDEYLNYLLITNNSPNNNPENAAFCLTINNKKSELPRGLVTIRSQGFFGKHRVSLQANRNVQLPDFLFNTFIQNQ